MLDVRFIHFSSDNFGKNNALSSKLGLETDGFNSSFILSKNMVAPTLLITTDQKTWDEKAELPLVINDVVNHEAFHAEERKDPSSSLSNDHSFDPIIETIQGSRTICQGL